MDSPCRGPGRTAAPRTRSASRTRLGLILAGVTAAILTGCATGNPPDSTPAAEATSPSLPTASPAPLRPSPTPRETTWDSPAASPTRQAPPLVPPTSAFASAPAGSAAAALADLPVRGWASKAGYSRSQFGQAWTDDVSVADGHDGCDTRNDILRRDLTGVVLKPGTHDCVVKQGTLHDPYTGGVISFTRGKHTSEAVQIDHVVALGDAWQTGAQQLSKATRTDLANDPLNLLAVSGRANDEKSDDDAARWLPPNRSFHCEYVALQIAVKRRYHLWATRAEHNAMARVLAACPSQRLPSGGAPVQSGPAQNAPAQSPTQGATGDGQLSWPGAFCPRPGDHGHTSAGARLVCVRDRQGRFSHWRTQ